MDILDLDYQSAKGMKSNKLRKEMRNPHKKQKLNDNATNDPSTLSLSANARSINDILPTDIIQNMLSWVFATTDIHMVNKKWYTMYKNIKQAQNREVREYIADFADLFEPQFDHKNNNTIVVDRNRTELTVTEKSSGFVGPFQFLWDALDECKSGDKILLYPGEYNISHNEWSRFESEHREGFQLQFIGMGDDVYVFVDDFDKFIIDRLQLIYFENINFSNEMRIFSGSVWIKKCVFDVEPSNPFCVLYCGPGGSVRVLQTRFLCRNLTVLEAVIYAPSFRKRLHGHIVEVIGCKFEDIKNVPACVHISSGKRNDWDEVKMIGNVFENINCFPIFSQCAPAWTLDSWEMHGNILKGTFEIDGLKEHVINPNVLFTSHD